MTVAEVDALLYLPGHPRQQLLRALRIPALSPGWQASFRALLDGEPGSGNAGLAATSPPPAWPGFRRLTVTAIERESDSVISIRLEDPDGAPLPRRAPRPVPDAARPARTRRSGRCSATTPSPGRPAPATTGSPSSASPTAPPAAICTPASRVGDQLEVAAPRGTFILDAERTRPVLLISAGIGATPVLAMLHALAAEHSDAGGLVAARRTQRPRRTRFAAEARALLASLPNARAHVCYSRPGPDDVEGRDFDSAGRLTAALLAELEPPARRRGVPLRARHRSWTRSAPAWPRWASTPPASTPSRSGPRRV